MYVLLSGKLPFCDKNTTKLSLRIAAGNYDLNSDRLSNVSGEAKVRTKGGALELYSLA